MKNTLLDNNDLIQKIIEATNSSRKHEFARFMKKNHVDYSIKIPFYTHHTHYNFSLLFQCTLFMFNKYYSDESARNAVTLLDIIERDDFNPYSTSIKGIPDFLLTYLFLFLSRTGHLLHKFRNHNYKNETYFKLVNEDIKYYFNEYYKKDYDHFYTDIVILASELYKMQHPLFNEDKIESFFADISVAFIMDRSNALISDTISPKTDTDKINPQKLRDIAYLPFISYKHFSKYIGNLTSPLKSIFHNYEYFNIKTVFKYSGFIFENDPFKKYSYCKEVMKSFLQYYNDVPLSTDGIVIGYEDTKMTILTAKYLIECLSEFEYFPNISQDEKLILSFLELTEDKKIVQTGLSFIMKYRLQNIFNKESDNEIKQKRKRL